MFAISKYFSNASLDILINSFTKHLSPRLLFTKIIIIINVRIHYFISLVTCVFIYFTCSPSNYLFRAYIIYLFDGITIDLFIGLCSNYFIDDSTIDLFIE